MCVVWLIRKHSSSRASGRVAGFSGTHGWVLLITLFLLSPGRGALGQDQLAAPPAPVPDTSYGEVIYDVEMVRLDGSKASLAAHEGEVLFINFWATWCAPCIAELPSIEALSRRLASDAVEVMMISVDDDLESVRQFVRENDIDGQVLLRSWEAGESTFRRAVIPTTYVISKDGMIVYRHSGAANWDAPEFAAFLRGLAVD